MEYYCIMVLSGKEKIFKKKATEELKKMFPSVDFYFFERKMFTEKRGWYTGALFSGYLFFQVEKLTSEVFSILRKINGFCRILPENQSPSKIQGDALKELSFLIRFGEVLGVSKVQFLPGQKVKAISGPLMGYEGCVLHVNKKQKRITVWSKLTKAGTTFDLKYEEAERVEE